MRLLRTFLHGILMMAVLTLGQSKAAETIRQRLKLLLWKGR